MPMTEQQHEAEWDAQTLAEAEVIKADTARFDAAQVAAASMSKEALIKAKSLENITKEIYPSMKPGSHGLPYEIPKKN